MELTKKKALELMRFSHLKGIIIPESVTEIGYAAFFGCRELPGVAIPQNVQLIQKLAFAGCTNLKKAEIDGTPVIEEDAFDSRFTEIIMHRNI